MTKDCQCSCHWGVRGNPFCDSCECYKPKSQWIRCTPETMPNNFETVLLFNKVMEVMYGFLRGSEYKLTDQYISEECIEIAYITHWMPLPSPPEDL